MWPNETDLLIYETFMTNLFFSLHRICLEHVNFFTFFCVVCKFQYFLYRMKNVSDSMRFKKIIVLHFFWSFL